MKSLSRGLPNIEGPITTPWHFAQRIAFRFVFTFFILFGPLFIFSVASAVVSLLPIPSLGHAVDGARAAIMHVWEDGFWSAVTQWIGTHLLNLPRSSVTPIRHGTETVYWWTRQLSLVLLSAVTTVVWSVLDRKRTEYRKLHDWFRIYLRYELGSIMLTYSAQKIFQVQFAPIGSTALSMMLVPLGQLSPMSMLWRFMGASAPYTIFAGLGEFVGGFLLFFRRTTTLGALILIAVMANVVAMNVSYDVMVKTSSTTYLFMAIVLVAPDLMRLADLLVLNRPTTPVDLTPPFSHGRGRRIRIALQTIVIVGITWKELHGARTLHRMLSSSPRSALYGIYDVEQRIRNGDTLSAADTTFFPQTVVAEFAGQFPGLGAVRIDTSAKRIIVGPQDRDTVTYGALPDTAHLLLTGRLNGDSVRILLRRREIFLLRPFRWVKDSAFRWWGPPEISPREM